MKQRPQLTLRLSEYRDWLENPVTKAVIELFDDLYYRETAEAVRGLHRLSSAKAKRQVEAIRGRQLVFEQFLVTDAEGELLIKKELDDIVDWE